MTGTLEAEARAQGVELDPLLREVNASPPVFWKRAKRVSIATMWLLGGSGVILYAGLLVYGLLARVEVDSAIIAGAVEPLKAPVAGTVTALSPRIGEVFPGGAVLFSVQDPDLDQAIGLQRVAVERARNDLESADATLAAERGRRDDYVVSQRFEIEKSAVLVTDLNSQNQLLAKRCADLADLYQRGLTQNWRLHEAQDKQAAVQQALSQARVQLKAQQAQLELALSGQATGGIEVIGRLAEMTAAVAHARTELALSEDALRVLLTRRGRASAVAAGPGRVLRILRLAGSQVQTGETVAVVERGNQRFIYAYLTQEEVGRVSIGDAAEVFLPAQRKVARAKITAVERAGAYLDDVETRYDWRIDRDNPQRLTDRDRTARVMLQFDGGDAAAAEQAVDVGTPVVLSFRRRWQGLLPGFGPLAANPGATS